MFNVHLSSPRAVIHNVVVGSHPADFVHTDHIASLNMSNAQDVHNHPELKRKVYSALQEGDEGELSIAIPKEVSLRQSGHRAVAGIVSEGAPDYPLHLEPVWIMVCSRHPRTSDARPHCSTSTSRPRIHAHTREHHIQSQEPGGWHPICTAIGVLPNGWWFRITESSLLTSR